MLKVNLCLVQNFIIPSQNCVVCNHIASLDEGVVDITYGAGDQFPI